MRNRPIFIKVREYVQSHSLTCEQVQNVTPEQVKNLLSLTDEEFLEYQQYESNIKNLIIRYLTDAVEKAELLELKSVAATWLLAHFPSAEWERKDRKIIIYLDGKPTNGEGEE